jgi:hypothetical protein
MNRQELLHVFTSSKNAKAHGARLHLLIATHDAQNRGEHVDDQRLGGGGAALRCVQSLPERQDGRDGALATQHVQQHTPVATPR